MISRWPTAGAVEPRPWGDARSASTQTVPAGGDGAMTALFVVGVAALVISLAMSIRPTVDQQPNPAESAVVLSRRPSPRCHAPRRRRCPRSSRRLTCRRAGDANRQAPPRTNSSKHLLTAPAPTARLPHPLPSARPAPASSAPAGRRPPGDRARAGHRSRHPGAGVLCPIAELPGPWEQQQTTPPKQQWPGQQSPPSQQWPGQQTPPSQRWPGQRGAGSASAVAGMAGSRAHRRRGNSRVSKIVAVTLVACAAEHASRLRPQWDPADSNRPANSGPGSAQVYGSGGGSERPRWKVRAATAVVLN